MGCTKCPVEYRYRRGDRMRWGLPAASWQKPRLGQAPLEELPTELRHVLNSRQVVDAMIGDMFRQYAAAIAARAETVAQRSLTTPVSCFDALFTDSVYAGLMETMKTHLWRQESTVTVEELRVWMALFMLRCANAETTEWVVGHYPEAATCGMSVARFVQLRRAIRLLPPRAHVPTDEVRLWQTVCMYRPCVRPCAWDAAGS